MRKTNKSVIVIDTPDDCLECPLRHQMELISMGNFIYKQVYGCRCMPEDIEDPCIPDVFSKPDWCPLISVKEDQYMPDIEKIYSKKTLYVQEMEEYLKKLKGATNEE